ncbi:MAG: DNA mismatch repair protein MutL, partial [Bacteroidaceae bacterium]|nr:DNA mismatch repair protein MutL [Bacteroidaceae bacterium]
VNIHPTKTEIKFEDESSLWKIISAAVKESLGRFNAAPSLDFDDENIPDIPVMDFSDYSSAPVAAPKISYTPGYNPFSKHRPERNSDSSSWEALYEGLSGDGKPLDLSPFEDVPDMPFDKQNVANEPLSVGDVIEDSGFVPMSQYKGQYILVPVKSGIMWVHQRRAHIRVLFEKYREQLSGNSAPSQGLLFPERVELTINEAVTLESVTDELHSLGFDISTLGGGTFVLNGVPAGIDGLQPAKLLVDLLHGAMEQTGEVGSSLHDAIALAMAKDVAIVKGQILSHDEMTVLVDALFATSMPSCTPDGLPVIYIMSDTEIDRNFVK